MTETTIVLERGAPQRHHDDIDDRYYLYPPTGELFPSYSTISDATWYKPWIAPWMTRKTAECCINDIALIAGLVGEGKHDEAREHIAAASEREWTIKANAGTFVHDVQGTLILRGSRPPEQRDSIPIPDLPERLAGVLYDEEPIEQVTTAMINGFHQFCKIWNPEFLASEMPVYHPELKCAGTLDMIVIIPDAKIIRSKATGKYILVHCKSSSVRLCIDTKTGREPGSLIWEQLAFYRRCKVCDIGLGNLRPMLKTDAGAVLHLRPEFANGFQLILVAKEDDITGWNNFQDALRIFHSRKNYPRRVGTVLRFPPRDGSDPVPWLEDLLHDGYGRAPNALRKAGIRDLAQLRELTAADCLNLHGIGKKTLPVIRQMLANHGLHFADETPGKAA